MGVCSVFTDLTKDDSDFTNNSKQHSCKSRTHLHKWMGRVKHSQTLQVITRFIASASPLIYWYCAHVVVKDTADLTHRQCSSKWRSKFIVGYFLLYFFIGTVLHCNFYPWT